jgi:lipid A 3-O-deacylase
LQGGPIGVTLRRIQPVVRIMRRLASLICLAFALAPGAVFGQCAVGSVQLENDIGLGGTDRHYTHGTRFSCISADQPEGSAVRRLGERIGFELLGIPMLDAGGDVRYSLALGQTMYTPEDTRRYGLIRDDRPYAGWLFGSVGLVLGPRWNTEGGSAAFERMETIELTVGMVGPASGAAETQKFVHSTIGGINPEGWHNQLENEPGVALAYEHAWRTESWPLPVLDAVHVDLMPTVGATVGNVHTFASTALTFRIGTRLANDFGPPRIRPSVAGSEYYDPSPDETLGAYLFVSVGGRAVARNVFLDGNTFADSHSVDRNVFVGDLQVGAVVSLWGRARLSLTHIVRTEEFAEQDSTDQFSAISLSFRF